MKIRTIAFLNGPNLNLLGFRKPELYGTDTLLKIERRISDAAQKQGFAIWTFQSNSESDLVDAIHTARTQCSAIIINPGAYSHTSIALRDALETFPGPIIEVHLSDIKKRESFRHHSYVSELAKEVICGKGAVGYEAALAAAIRFLEV